MASGRFTEAIEPLRDVVSRYEELGEDVVGYKIFAPRQNLAVAMLQSGQEREAVEQLRSIVAQMAATFGPSHPTLAPVLLNLAGACDAVGDHACSARAYERLEPLVRHYHEEPSALAAAFAHGIGGVHARDERFRLAHRYRLDALRLARSVHGEDHPQTAIIIYGLGVVEFELGELRTAYRRFERASEIFERRLGVDHPYRAKVEVALARVEYRLGHTDVAERHARAAQAAGASSREVRVAAVRLLGGIALRRGQAQVAKQRLEEAMRLSKQGEAVVGDFETRRVQAELGAALAELGESDGAGTILAELRALATSPDFTPRQRALLQLGAADVAQRLGRVDDARVLIDEATRQSLRAPASTEAFRKEISTWRRNAGI